MPFAYVSITIAAVAGTKPDEAGLASGLINTSQQIGGAVGIAVLTTIAVSHTDNAFATGASQPVALTDGFAAAFWAGAAISFAGLLVSIFLVRGRDLQHGEATAPEPCGWGCPSATGQQRTASSRRSSGAWSSESSCGAIRSSAGWSSCPCRRGMLRSRARRRPSRRWPRGGWRWPWHHRAGPAGVPVATDGLWGHNLAV